MEKFSTISTDFGTKTQEVAEVIQGQLSWMETNGAFPEHLPQKTTENLNIEFELMDFSIKDTARLTIGVGKTLERCMVFYKRIITTHNRCHYSKKIPRIS